MSWTNLSAFTLDQIAAYQDLNEVRGNLIALKEFPTAYPLGGDPATLYTNTSYAEVVWPIRCQIPDASNLDGLTYEVWAMVQATSGDTITVQLWNETDAAEVVSVASVVTTLTLVKSATFLLPAGSNRSLTVRVKAATGGVASPFRAYGFLLVRR